MATEKRRKNSGGKSSAKSGGRSGGQASRKRTSKGRKRRPSTGTRLAIAIAECLVMVLITGAVLFLLNRSQPAGGGSLPQVYTANLPSPGEGTLVLSTESVFTGSDGGPCLYRLEEGGGKYYVRAVSVQTQAYDEGRVAVSGVTEFEVPYVMAATAPLQDGAQVELAK